MTEGEQRLLDDLRNLRDRVNSGTGYEADLGICHNINREIGREVYLEDMFKRWPERDSSNECFPVGGSDEYMENDDLWDQDTDNGRKRMRLLNWLIVELNMIEVNSHGNQ